ncbi:proteasome core particle subunit alpha 2 [Ascoidea rubescens DSM 1968]|uniref:Proteasome component Y7 n=1 Tax=Ascoidea rubescens DSM 1968 TaxID=1344418 RepID=A0A1D2VSD5_9ASCO|nr:proteasome component Y7 [Ascoidea rubescens DSM 1968]ODV64509.1 proteasome component Y7 [Ascoidea rubescens DSM 1968]
MADRYSFSLTTFSPSGKLVQIEYALNAVNQGVIALGIKATNGVVLATEKKSNSSLIKLDSFSKIELLTPDIGVTYAGMSPDFRVLVDKSRKLAHTNYKRIFNEYPPVKILTSDIAKTMQEATQSGGVRPFGVSLLVAGYDDSSNTINPDNDSSASNTKSGYNLYQVDPSGSFFAWKATAIGKNANSAKTFLEKRYNPELELEDAIHIALLTLKESIEGDLNGNTIEIAIVGEANDNLLGFRGSSDVSGPRFKKLSPKEIDDRLSEL